MSVGRTISLSAIGSALLVLGAGCVPDTDGDGALDAVDVCIATPDPSQLDADHDGIGNACDADFDQDGVVNFSDLARMKATFGTSDRVTDLNGDGSVDDLDLAILKALFYAAPGPSAHGDDVNLYVSAQAAPNGDGGFASPYRRITDAVAHARADRASAVLSPAQAIRIHVAGGVYVGSYDAAALQSHPEYEVLPIVIDVPDVLLFGSTVLTLDEGGLPTGSEVEGRTVLRSDTQLRANQALLVLGRTTQGAGDGALVEGFVLDGVVPEFLSQAVWADRVQGFRIQRNRVRGTGFGIQTRLASGAIEGNLLSLNGESGASVSGGSVADPAAIALRGNRVIAEGQHGIMVLATASTWPIDLGLSGIELEPLQTSFDRSEPADLARIPDRIEATLTGNEITGARVFGVRLMAAIPVASTDCSQPVAYETSNPANPVAANIVAHVADNTFSRIGLYGIGAELGFPCRSDARPVVYTVTATFQANTFVNTLGALFSFNTWGVTLGFDTATRFKFAEGSSYEATDLGGGLAGFYYDHPVTDPVSGTVLGNTFEVNGAVVPNGTVLTP